MKAPSLVLLCWFSPPTGALLRSAARFQTSPRITQLSGIGAKAWVTDGLLQELDSDSAELSGQGDVMPPAGLRIGRLHVVPAGMAEYQVEAFSQGADGLIRLGNSENGWGTGCHPTTKLCLEFLSDQLQGFGETVLDYGTGR